MYHTYTCPDLTRALHDMSMTCRRPWKEEATPIFAENGVPVYQRLLSCACIALTQEQNMLGLLNLLAGKGFV